MTNKKSTKRALLFSVLSLVLCFSMLVGTTFAWFTDSVTSANNIIQSGNLDITLEYYDGTDWKDVKDSSEILDKDALWEPGYTEVAYFRIKNNGSLALKYQFGVNIVSETEGVNMANESYKLSDYIYFDMFEGVDGKTAPFTDRDAAMANTTETTKISAGYAKAGTLTATDGYVYLAMVIYMPETVGNEANARTKDETGKIELGINIVATQVTAESDAFNNTYDEGATYPVDIAVTKPVSTDSNNKTTSSVAISYQANYDNGSSAVSEANVTVPAGAQLEAGATQLTLKIEEAENVNPDVATQITSDQTATTYEISLEGLADTNDQDVEVSLVIEKGLVDVKLYHKGTLIPCTYDAFTGELTFTTKGFSPFTVVSATKLFDEGKGTAEDPYIIKTPEDMLNISEYYHEYKYYKVADGVETLDLNGIGNLYLNGSFDGNGVKIENLTTALFRTVGLSGVEATIKISNMDVTVHTTNGNALVRNIFNEGNTIFENVAMHGYIEGQYNMGSFYNYGTANSGTSDGSDYTVSFVNATSDVTLVCTTGNVMGGMLGHGYEGANYKLYINMDEKSGYTGKMYTTNGKDCYQVMAMCSHATYVLNGEEVSRYTNTYPSTKLTIVAPTAGDDGYYVTPVDGVASYVVALNAQITAYDKNGNKIANLSGMTGNLGSTTVTEGFDGKIFDLIKSAKIVNGLDNNYSYKLNNGALTVYTGKSSNYASGWFTLQVNQYDAEGNLLATGITTVYEIKEVSTADKMVEALENGNGVVMTNNIKIDPANMSNAYGTTGINITKGQTFDGNGFVLDIKGAGGTWDSGINTTGGLIKNVTVTGSFRGIFINHNSNYRETVVLENVIIDGTTYTISCDQGLNQNLEATGCTFNGWTSFAATLGTAKFTDCDFGEGNGYAYCRPYAPTTFVGCDFEAGFELDARAAVTFENCTIGGEPLTAENLATLVTSNIANATVK